MIYKLERYETASGKTPIKIYMENLRKKHKIKDIAQIFEYFGMLSKYGYDINKEFKPEAIKQVKDKIWELRPSRHRIFFFFFHNNTIVLLHGYFKASRVTPNYEKDKAIEEMTEYLREKENE